MAVQGPAESLLSFRLRAKEGGIAACHRQNMWGPTLKAFLIRSLHFRAASAAALLEALQLHLVRKSLSVTCAGR